MKFCEKCGQELLDEAILCPGCGCAVKTVETAAPVTEPAKTKKRGIKALWVVLSVVALVLGVIAAILFPIKEESDD